MVQVVVGNLKVGGGRTFVVICVRDGMVWNCEFFCGGG